MNERFLAYLFAWAVDRIVTVIFNCDGSNEVHIRECSYLELNEQADTLIEEYKPNGK